MRRPPLIILNDKGIYFFKSIDEGMRRKRRLTTF